MANIIHRSFVSLLILISSVDPPTAYDVLEEHGLPRGILPEGVDSYLLRSDGSFDAYLAADECEVEVRSSSSSSSGERVLKYERKIGGVLESGSIKKMRGVSVKVLLAWVRVHAVVVAVDRSGEGLISFQAGPAGLLRADFPLANFGECPRCTRRRFKH